MVNIEAFFKQILTSEKPNFFQYSFRPEMKNIGSVSTDEKKLKNYHVDNIRGFTTVEQMLSLNPVNLCCHVNSETKITYSLKKTETLDWSRDARVLQVGIHKAGLHIKIFEFIASKNQEEIHYTISAFEGADKIIASTNWKEDSFVNDKLPSLSLAKIITTSFDFEKNKVFGFFVSKKSLTVNSIFCNVFSPAKTSLIDEEVRASEHQFNKVDIFEPCELDFAISNWPDDIEEVNVHVTDEEHIKNLIVNSKNLFSLQFKTNLENNSIISNLRQGRLNKLSNEPCVIIYRDKVKSGTVLSNSMEFEVIKNKLKEEKSLSVKFITKKSVSPTHFDWLEETLGEKVGYTSWYEEYVPKQ